MVFLAYTHIVL